MEVVETPETERTAAETRPAAAQGEPELAAHPGPKEYVKVAVVLAAATAAEVALYYMTALPHGVFIALLMFAMVFKFSLVALWFMHLRFDARIFRRLFVTGLLLAISVYMIVLVIFGVINAGFLLAFTAGLLLLVGFLVLSMSRTAVRVQAGAAPGGPPHDSPPAG
jgi:cytochrome c oxidase subunit 4